jgi:hypothetical protein
MKENKIYLGDGLYAEYDGLQVRLYTSDGIRETNEVFLEDFVLQVLDWLKRSEIIQ